MQKRQLNNKILILVLIFLAIVIFYSPILFSFNTLGIQDWDQSFSWNEFTRLSILKYRQFPFWDPYRCGGAVHFANPQMSVVSLQTLLVLVFGTINGIKISIIIHSLIGFVGFYLLSRQHKTSVRGSILAATIFSFSGIVGSYLATGMVVFINVAYMPYILFFYIKAEKRKMYLYIAAGLMAFSYYFGYHITLLMAVFLAIYSLISGLHKRSFKPVIQILLFTIVFLILSAPKLILSLQLYSIFPRLTIGQDRSGYKFIYLIYYLISRKQNLFEDMDLPRYSFHIDENSLYVGLLPVLFFLFFFYRNKDGIKRIFSLLITFIIIIFLISGYYAFPYIYAFLKLLPIFSSYEVAQRFRFDFIIIFALLAGLGFDRLTLFFKNNKKITKILFFFVIAVIYFDLASFSIKNFLRPTLIIKDNFPRNETKIFSQKSSISQYLNYSYVKNIIPESLENTDTFAPLSLEYVAIQNNTGTIKCYDSITEKVAAVGEDSPDYRGESYLKNNSGKIKLKRWSPNILTFDVQLNKSINQDLLVVNQNYFPGWYVSVDDEPLKRAENYNGLIAGKISSSNNTISFKFLPFLGLLDL